MFFYQSMKWPSPSAFLPKFFRSSQGTPSHPDTSPQKPKRWTFPVLPLHSLPSLPSFQLFLPSLKRGKDVKTTSESHIDFEHFQICINLVHHIIDICTCGCLWLFSPVFRVTLDIFGFQGALKLWIHGIAIFLATTYGMYLILWLAQEYIFQLASFYGILQTFVLIVSLKAEQESGKGQQEEEKLNDHKDEGESEGGHPEDRWAEGGHPDDKWAEGGHPEDRWAEGGHPEDRWAEGEHPEDRWAEGGHPEDRWAGGEEDDEGNSQDEWESEGEEVLGHA
ncbi:uncharacterized protein LOC120977480 [Bufo bufo]|uniref:uncharacterized protein LOC120977480 n=1 Tax=Bufo bufo TaxID=8384 RepID=UPI001ABE72FD|nr:uncharacterized protein LOC120977480 [Bufo bufo]